MVVGSRVSIEAQLQAELSKPLDQVDVEILGMLSEALQVERGVEDAGLTSLEVEAILIGGVPINTDD